MRTRTLALLAASVLATAAGRGQEGLSLPLSDLPDPHTSRLLSKPGTSNSRQRAEVCVNR
ncbi:MAG: hypothetical protein H6Q05_4782 [Acidobacteria bacterium]|jgi:hypothetical protein|nr:hypothetical protein [Acidobacteriota bacterium]